MTAHFLLKACILAATFLLLAAPAAADCNNPEEPPASDPSDDGGKGPCNVILAGTESPYVDPHPECIGSGDRLVSFA